MTHETPTTGYLRRFANVAGCWLICALGALLLFARAMDRDLNHDEHQFLAPAALLSREGLLPWHDYPLFHLPNLVFLYGALDFVCGNLVLCAKLVSCVATIGMLVALTRMNAGPRRAGFFGALVITAFLLTDPLVRYTAGKTWNHEVPTALLIAAIGVYVAAARTDRFLLTALAGVLAGLAAGCRLTFAPVLIGMAGLAWFFPGRLGRRFTHLVVLTCSATAALAPSLWFLATSREAFLFGNFEFPRLRLLDPTNTRVQKTATFWRKLRFLLKEVILPSWPVFLLWGTTAALSGWRWFRTRAEPDRTAAFTLVLIPFVVFGCFSPLRYQHQHYFVLIPLLLYASSSAMHWEHWRGKRKLILLGASTLVAGILSWKAAPDYKAVALVANRSDWYDARLRRNGELMRNVVSTGPVLTLAPTIPLAGGLSTYPEFAPGPFAWRSAWLVAPERRPHLHLVAPDDLSTLLSIRPPAAILTGVEDEPLEQPLVDWAKTHGWREVRIRKKQTAWLPPTL